MFKLRVGHNPDYIFIGCVLLLVIFGLFMLSSASSDLGKIKFNDTFYYLKHQLLFGLIFGLAGFIFAVIVHYHLWQKLAIPLLFLGLLLMVLVFTPLGFSHAGANRWLNLGPLSVQPAELLKFSFVVYLAAWLSAKREKSFIRQTNFWGGYLPFLIISGLVAFLILVQPSTATAAIILASGLLVYFASGARLSFILGTAFLGLITLILIVHFTPYRLERVQIYIETLFRPEAIDSLDKGYHISQARTAISSGGLWGVGFGKSTTKFKYLPEPISDSIFAVIAEELGFIGAVSLMGIFALLFARGIAVAKNSRDQFAKLVTLGFIFIITIQTLIHIAAISGIAPLTGVPLPFISYGGTSLAVFLTMAGVIVNISRYT